VIPAPVPAPPKQRTLAGLIDAGIVVAYVAVIGMLLAVVFPLVTGPTPLWVEIMLAMLFIEVPITVWWVRQESLTGTTIGKKFKGLRVVRMGTDDQASTRHYVVRVVAQILPWAIVHIFILVAADPRYENQWYWSLPLMTLAGTAGVISILVAYFRIDHRTGYDLIAGTQVVLVQ